MKTFSEFIADLETATSGVTQSFAKLLRDPDAYQAAFPDVRSGSRLSGIGHALLENSAEAAPARAFFQDTLRTVNPTPDRYFSSDFLESKSSYGRRRNSASKTPSANESTAQDRFLIAVLSDVSGIKAHYQPDFLSNANQTEEAFLQVLLEADVSESAIATLILSCHQNQFGWTRQPCDDWPMGWGQDFRYYNLIAPTSREQLSPLEAWVISLNEKTMGQFSKKFAPTLACFQPEMLEDFLDNTPTDSLVEFPWRGILRATDRFDKLAAEVFQEMPQERREAHLAFYHHERGIELEPLTAAATCNDTNLCHLLETKPAIAFSVFEKAYDQGFDLKNLLDHTISQLNRTLAQQWPKESRALVTKIIGSPLVIRQLYYESVSCLSSSLFKSMLSEASKLTPEEGESLLDALLAVITESSLDKDPKRMLEQQVVEAISNTRPELLPDFLWQTLSHKSKVQRDLAIAGLAKAQPTDLLARASELLSARKADVRISAAKLLESVGDEQAVPALTETLEKEKSEKVLSAIHAALAACGNAIENVLPEQSLAELCQAGAKLKLPKTSFLNLAALPPLPTADGSPLPEGGLSFLIAKQSKHKPIEPAPEALPLLAEIDPNKSSDFALALYQHWLASEQAAKDRWVLTLTGLLGGERAIPELMAPINDWALNSRHKLAEYAAQAISLVPGDTALTLLDSLANRYRSKFKNIGKACRAALETAAVNRGVSLDELSDLIVPTLDFDDEGQRPLEDSDIQAVLQPDFKLSFYNPETEKETKSPPSTLSDTAKEDLKTLRKLIRETIKGQTTRLEGCLVRQRRWTIARWQELFENHPLLQTYANNLVWATYDKTRNLQRTFRRYPNGLLANAGGELIEFEKDEIEVGMVHPLELSAEDLLAWQQHLDRMKVKPPFAQLDRPIALLEAQHGNRKELKTADKQELSCGTFRSRAEKRGWQRGSVVDAGGICYYYKSYQGAGVDVFLYVEDMWVGQDPMDEIALGTAMFVQGDSVHIGSYEYNEPNNTDDPRVLAFGKVPPIVYSETVTDLQAIAGIES